MTDDLLAAMVFNEESFNKMNDEFIRSCDILLLFCGFHWYNVRKSTLKHLCYLCILYLHLCKTNWYRNRVHVQFIIIISLFCIIWLVSPTPFTKKTSPHQLIQSVEFHGFWIYVVLSLRSKTVLWRRSHFSESYFTHRASSKNLYLQFPITKALHSRIHYPLDRTRQDKHSPIRDQIRARI